MANYISQPPALGRLFGICIWLFLLHFPLPRVAHADLYPPNVTAFDEAAKQGQKQAAEEIAREIKEAISQGKSTFVIPPGEYRFSQSKVPGLLITANNLEINAVGARFWFNGQIRQDGIVLKNCDNVSLRGLTIDYDPYCRTSQGTITQIDRDAKRLVVSLDKGYPKPDSSWFTPAGMVKTIFFNPQGSLRPVTIDWLTWTAPVENGSIECGFRFNRVFASGSEVQEGDRIAMPDRSMRMTVVLQDCQNVSLENVTIYAAPQMAIVEEGGNGGNNYRKCRVIRQPETNRLLACNADVFHSVAVKKGPHIEDCEFSCAGDDLVNIQSYFSLVWEPISANRAVVAMPSKSIPPVGTTIQFSHAAKLGEARITEIKDRPDLSKEWMDHPDFLQNKELPLVQFSKGFWSAKEIIYDPPTQLGKFDFLTSSEDVATGTTIRNSYFHDTIARGILLKCHDGEVANNRIERTGLPGIMLATDTYFLEGPFPTHIAVKQNQLADNAFSPQARTLFDGYHAAIAVWADNGKRRFSEQKGLLSGIEISENQIERSSGTAIFMANGSDGLIRANQIKEPGALPPLPNAEKTLLKNRFAIVVTNSKNVQILDNKMTAPHPDILGLQIDDEN